MKKTVSLKFSLCLGLAICVMFSAAVLGISTDADAASWDAGDWKVSMGGNVNAFYVYTMCDNGDMAASIANGGPATWTGYACAGATDKDDNFDDYHSVQNGLLPASLNFSAATNQDGWDISANVNVYYGIVSRGTNRDDTGTSDALQFSTVDARQVYLTFGKKDLGTVKMGRDFGLFAFDAIINDMSLLGVGGGHLSADPAHTTLGGLGFGYVYTDRLAQIDYTTPNWGGFQATVGIFEGFDGNGARNADTPGYHAKVSFSWTGPAPGMASATYLNQDVITTVGTDEEIKGWDFFAKVNIGPVGLLGYYYDAEGMTSLAIGGYAFPGFGTDAVTGATGTPEEVDGYMAQVTWTIIPPLRIGLNYSANESDKVTLMENEKWTFGVYYNLTPALTLLAEYSDMESQRNEASFGVNDTDEAQNFNIGAILFF
ncbi:MAG: porin [Desulfobacteraceae bacterium]